MTNNTIQQSECHIVGFGAKIKARRKELGLTLQELADKTSSSKSYIWELESKQDIRRPSALKMLAIAASLRVTTEWLMGDEVESDEAEDAAFFNQYKLLPHEQKMQLRQIMEIIKP